MKGLEREAGEAVDDGGREWRFLRIGGADERRNQESTRKGTDQTEGMW